MNGERGTHPCEKSGGKEKEEEESNYGGKDDDEGDESSDSDIGDLCGDFRRVTFVRMNLDLANVQRPIARPACR